MLCNGPFPKCFLQNLEYLEVRHCYQLKEIHKIDEGVYTREENQPQLLSNLEHLELNTLPELRWIWKASAHYFSLQSLKVVKIFWCNKLTSLFSPSLIQSLLQLEELHITCCAKLKTLFGELESGGEAESNRHLHPLCLPRLTTLFIFDCERLEYVLPITLAQGLPQLEHCIKLPRLKDLSLYHFKGLSSFCPENYFVKAPVLEKLSVSAWNNQVHLQKNVDLDGLTSLQLRDCKDLECLVDTTEEYVPTSEMFSNLVELFMVDLIDLKMLCNGQPPKGFLQNLETLEVDRCMDIVSLSFVAQNLKKLTVNYCEKLQEVFRIDELHYNREGNQEPLLSNLDSLDLLALPELRWILKGSTQCVSLGCLKVVLIRTCNKLESLFSTSLIRSLRLLEELNIISCAKLETVFGELESDDETESNTLCLPNLKTLQISECPRLKYVWPLASTLGLPRLKELQLGDLRNFDPERDFIKAPALEDLWVYNCPGLSKFTIQQDKPFQSKLRTIDIARCEKLDQIIVNGDMSASSSQGHDQQHFPELKFLSLNWLPSLTSFCPVGYHLVFPSLDSLSIGDCSKMITSFTIDSTTLYVHAKTKAPPLDDTSPSERDIWWTIYNNSTSLPPYVEEADEISELK